MKLKKIASLMLAGIMAVSMLAGCKSGSNNNNNDDSSSSQPTVQTSELSGILNETRTDWVKTNLKLSYTDSSSLNKILSAVAEDVYGSDSDAVETAAGKNNFASAADVTAGVGSKISEKMNGTFVTAFNSFAAGKGTYKMVKVYTVGGGYDEKAAGNAIASSLNNVVGSANAVVSNGTLRADYSAEVAAVKVTSNDHPEQNAWVIAVVYTQTVSGING